jgi:hypothetical protein
MEQGVSELISDVLVSGVSVQGSLDLCYGFKGPLLNKSFDVYVQRSTLRSKARQRGATRGERERIRLKGAEAQQ